MRRIPLTTEEKMRMDVLEGIARGERAIDEGSVISHAALKRSLKRWRRGRPRKLALR